MYDITTEGDVGAFLNPTLAFGHRSPHGGLPIICAAVFGLAVVGLVIARVWASRVRRRAVPTVGYYAPPPAFGMPVQPPEPFTPNEDGIRIEQLKTLAQLRDSGALTEDEFEAEKRRILRS